MNDVEAIARITRPYDAFLTRRIATVSNLFAEDAYSIDAIIIAGTVLTALGFRRYGARGPGADQVSFERLLIEYWPGYVDRVSVPEIVRSLESARPPERDHALIDAIRRTFVVDLPYGQLRRVAEDPLRSEWNDWLNNTNFDFREASRFSYARIVFRDFRNSVQHRLDIAMGEEARRQGLEEPFFYANYVGSVRFGFHHPRFEQVLREVAAGLRAWALAERRDIFAR